MDAHKYTHMEACKPVTFKMEIDFTVVRTHIEYKSYADALKPRAPKPTPKTKQVCLSHSAFTPTLCLPTLGRI